MNLAQVLDTDILPLVQKPSRYLGNEVNAVRKSPEEIDVRIALAFPDLYDIGLGNLGIHILYTCLNRLPWGACERVFAPDLDMEQQLRSRGLPLFALESKDSLDEFDGIGFTLQSELTWTNILNMIDLSGIPLRTEDRREHDPLTFAGGPAVFNPEPLAPFMDFFVMGDGEDAILEIAEVLRALRQASRAERLRIIGEIDGVYVPALYPMETLPNGQIVPVQNARKIRKRITRDLNGATFPTDYIVPFTRQVHDRISLEVLRGCTQGCRFCQAGMVTRPVRERTIDNVNELLERTLDNTGYEEVSLVSLSTCDHSRVKQLVENTVETVRSRRVSVSLPSLRLDSFSVELSDMVAEERRSGLTFAPEAASPRLRAVINKWIPDDELLEMSAAAYERGWNHVKLYFMIGLPTERDDDIVAIADLASRTLDVGKTYARRNRVNLGVSTFVPKPFTPFQWCEQIDHRETARRQDLLQTHLNHPDIKFGRHDPEETFIEGLFSRTDRRAATLLEAAFRKGCRFDAWREHLRFDLWMEAVEETGFDVADALRARDVNERLPWDHIDVLIPKSWFREDYERAMELKHAQDCRHRRCHRCGVIDEERALCASMLRDNIEHRKLEQSWQRKPTPEHVEPPPVQRLWLRVGRVGAARHLSHIELANAWIRALRRVGVQLSYSQGFHPHPRMAFSAALPVGLESRGEYMDLTLVERIEPEELVVRLRDTVPEGFLVSSCHEVALKVPSLMSLADGGEYRIDLADGERDQAAARVADLIAQDSIRVQRKTKVRKKGKRGRFRRRRERRFIELDIRPMIQRLEVVDEGRAIQFTLASHEGKPGKAKELVALLFDDPLRVRVTKLDTFCRHAGGWPSFRVPEAEGMSGPSPVA